MATRKTAVVMDPIGGITPAKDSSLAMLLEAQKRGHELVYFELPGLELRDGVPKGRGHQLVVSNKEERWFELGPPQELDLGDMDIILMRKDPPFDTEYIYTTYILERAEEKGALVVNRPASLRDINEKVFTAWFAQCCPTTLITRSMDELRAFTAKQGEIVVKPLDGMGGHMIFVVRSGDNNANVIFETLTAHGSRFAMAQTYIPEISNGDKRILIVDGEPIPMALARVPPPDDNRGNLVAGAKPEMRELTDRDRWICSEVGPELKKRGVIFAGLDVIGDYLTEINVTSPTGIRELKRYADLDAAVRLFDALDERLG